MAFPLPIHGVHPYNAPVIILSGLVLAFLFCCPPCLAVGYFYPDADEQPILGAQPSGDNYYYPGDTFTMTVLLSNTGKDTAMIVAPLLAPGAYNPSTALGVTVIPRTSDAPVTLKTLPIMVGDIGSGDQVPVTIEGTIHPDAQPGIITLLFDVTYRYIYAIPMTGADYLTFTPLYQGKEQTLPVRIRIEREVRPALIGEKTENMVPGTQGYVTAEIKNSGYATGKEVIFRIVPSDNVTFQMVDEGVYVGMFGPGDVVPVRVRIAVKEHTAAGSYPAVLQGEYHDDYGVLRNTPPVPLGIHVSRGAVIEVLTNNLTIAPGTTETITVQYKNTGDAPARNAQANIIGNQVIMPIEDTAFLGDFSPGEIKSAQFVISAAHSGITGKQYIIDTGVKYRDSLDALMLSDKLSFGVEVQSPTGVSAITTNPVILIIIIGVLAIAIYTVWKIRYKKT